MSNENIKILVVDDEAPIRDVLSASLKDEAYNVETAEDGLSGLEKMASFEPSVVLLDIWMPGDVDGLEVLKRAKARYQNTDFIIMSGHGTIETAVKATKLGAFDFVEKPLSMEKINILINNILLLQKERSQSAQLLNHLRQSIAMVSGSAIMSDVKSQLATLAQGKDHLLVTGAKGTGRRLSAHNLHYLGPRASRNFVEVNSEAIPATLVESKLFGYVSGFYPGGKNENGAIMDAIDGTLFIQEVAGLPLETQEKLARFIATGEFKTLGSDIAEKSNAKVIFSTSKDLEALKNEGQFDPVLFEVLSKMEKVVLPKLSERKDDIPMLFDYFSNTFIKHSGIAKKQISEKALEDLKTYDWPGQVRELKNFVERLYILTPEDEIDSADLRYAGLDVTASSGSRSLNFRQARAAFERQFLIDKIAENNGNISKTAESIGLERSYLHRKIRTYQIETKN